MIPRLSDSARSYYEALLCDPLTAYRRDLERVADLVRFGSADDRWIRDALRLERLVAARSLRATALRTLAKEPLLQSSRLLGLTERIEAAGALVLAFNMLESARRVWNVTDAHAAGMALCRQGRICRTIGDTDTASRYYQAAILLGVRRRMPDVRGGALLGRGVMHGMSGDLASAYRAFGEARRVAAQTPAIVAGAYLGEIKTALQHEDGNRVIMTGSRALQAAALTGPDQAVLLMLIASVALRAQQPRAAGMALQRALANSRHPRLRMHLFANMAKVAATLGDHEAVAKWARKFGIAATRVNLPLDEVSARSEIAQAFAIIGETTRARRLATAVRAQAVTLGLAIVIRECDAILRKRAAAISPMRLSRPALRVIARFEGV